MTTMAHLLPVVSTWLRLYETPMKGLVTNAVIIAQHDKIQADLSILVRIPQLSPRQQLAYHAAT